MATRRRASRRAAVAAERGVAVAGDIVGSLIVTGDDVSVELKVGPESGALLEQLALLQRPKIRKRRPARPLQRFPNHLDRSTETADVVSALQAQPVNVHGEAGIGKTYVLCDVASRPLDDLGREDVVFLFARGKSNDDLLQAIFDELYDTAPPTRPSTAQVARLFRRRKPLLLLDSLELERDEAQALVLSLPTCAVVAASRSRVLWDGHSLRLDGLSLEDAHALVEQELGRALEPEEAAATERLWQILEGNPLRLRQAAAVVKELGGQLSFPAGGAATARSAEKSLVDEALRSLSGDERLLLAVLVQLGGVDVSSERLAQLVDQPDVTTALEKLRRLGLAEAHSPRYSASGVTVAEPSSLSDLLPEAGRRLVDSLLAWLQTGPFLEDVVRELAALVAAVRLAHRSERLRETIELGRAIDAALAWSRRWDAWQNVLSRVLEAARAMGDGKSEAWALHQLGTRAACLGHTVAATEALREALEIRRQLGDDEGASVTARNLEVGLEPPPLLTRIWNRWLFTVPLSVILGGILTALIFGGGGAAAAIALSGHGASGVPSTSQAQTATLAIRFQGDGSGSVSIDPLGLACPQHCQRRLDLGTMLTLRPVAARGSRFTGWRECPDVVDEVCEFTLTEDLTLTAVFVRRSHETRELRVSAENGRVTSEPSGIDCPSACTKRFPLRTEMTLKVAEEPPFAFESWEGCPEERGAECAVVMDQDRQIRALFRRTENTHTLTVRVLGPDGKSIGGTVTSDLGGITCRDECQQIFNEGTTVALSATADSSFAFDSWDGCPEPEDMECGVTLDADHLVKAVFRAVQVEEPTLTPPSHDFGNVEIFTSGEPFSFTLQAGSATLTPQAQLSATKDFTLANRCDTTLAAGQTCTLDVTFTPVVSGSHNATLTVNRKDGATLTASLTGAGNVVPPTLTPPAHGFGTIDVGKTGAPLSFTLTAGSEPLGFTASLGGTKDFTLGGNCTRALDRHRSCTLDVTFTPVAEGERSATLTVNRVNGPSLSSRLTGTGNIALPTLAPTTLDFGTIYLNRRSTAKTFTVTSGSLALGQLTPSTNSRDFIVSRNSCSGTVTPFTRCEFDVVFTPTAFGDRSETLSVAAGSTLLTANLQGYGWAKATWSTKPTTVTLSVDHFGETKTGTVTLIVSRASAAPLLYEDLTVSGSTYFRAASDCRPPVPVASTCTVTVTFTPMEPLDDTNRRARLTILSRNGGIRTVSLSGYINPECATRTAGARSVAS